MSYLLIPVVVFCVVTCFIYRSRPVRQHERVFEDRVENIPIVASVLETSRLGEPKLTLQLNDSPAAMQVRFLSDQIKVAVPLIAGLKRSKQDEFAKFVRDRLLRPAAKRKSGKQVALHFSLNRAPDDTADKLEDAFSCLFDVSPDSELTMKVVAANVDLNFLTSILGSDDPDARFQQEFEGWRHKGKKHWQITLYRLRFAANMLFVPPVLVATFLAYGIRAFCAAALVALMIKMAMQLAGDERPFDDAGGWIWLLVVGLFAHAAFTDQFDYVQMVPTILCGLTALALLASAVPCRLAWQRFLQFSPKLCDCNLKSAQDGSIGGPVLIPVAIGIAALAAATNEYVRANETLETWVWLYSFMWPVVMSAVAVAFLVTVLIASLQEVCGKEQR